MTKAILTVTPTAYIGSSPGWLDLMKDRSTPDGHSDNLHGGFPERQVFITITSTAYIRSSR